MQNVAIEEDKRGRVEMRVHFNSDEIDEFNAEERRESDKGFTAGRTFRKIANIDQDEFHGLYMLKDKDAVDFVDSGGTDRKALNRLLIRFPVWRCSEGRI